MNEGKEIREIIDDIKNIINESYVFDEQQPQLKVQPNMQQKNQSINTPIQEDPDNKEDFNIKGDNLSSNDFDTKITQIRKIAIQLMTGLDPSSDSESYRLIKGIWDSCDKYLIKDSISKPKNNNNNI